MRSIARGPLWTEFESSQRTSLSLNVTLPPLGPAFIPKGKVGRHFKSISRNGLILVMSAVPLKELAESASVQLRLSIWHSSHLPSEPALPYGLLLYAQPLQIISTQPRERLYRAEMTASHSTGAAFSLELGGGRFLNIFEKQTSRDS